MKTDRKTFAALAIGLILLAMTLLLFLLLRTERQTVHWVALVFLLLAEIGATGGFIYINSYAARAEGPFKPAGVYSLLGAYLLVTALISQLYFINAGKSLTTLICVQTGVLALTTVTVILLLSSGSSLGQSSHHTLNAGAKLHQLEQRLLAQKGARQPLAEPLNQLYEAVRFADHSVFVAEDEELAARLDALEAAEDEAAAQALIEEMLQISERRNAAVKDLKRGGV